jgi:hypothetical protein
VSTGLDGILAPGHPVRALAKAELGKLLSVDEPVSSRSGQHVAVSSANDKSSFPPTGIARLRLAYETLARAHDELRVGFGIASEGGEVGQSIRVILMGLEKELGVIANGVKNAAQHGGLTWTS